MEEAVGGSGRIVCGRVEGQPECGGAAVGGGSRTSCGGAEEAVGGGGGGWAL